MDFDVTTTPAGQTLMHSMPAAAYLASLRSEVGRKGMVSALNTIAEISSGDRNWRTMDWRTLNAANAGAIRGKLKGSPATINKALAALRGVAKQLFIAHVIDADELERIKMASAVVPGSRLQSGRAMEDWELAALMRVCADATDPANARDACAIALAAKTGCRRAELAGIRLQDMTMRADYAEIAVIGKGNKQRLLHVDNGALKALKAWLALRGGDGEFLFCPINKGGKINAMRGLTTTAFDQLLIKRCEAAKVANLDWHDLRRTVATRLLDAGSDLVVVRDVLGHADIHTTARYDHRSEDAKRRAVAKISVPYFG